MKSGNSSPLFILQNKLSPKAQIPKGISNFILQQISVLLPETTKKGKVPEHPPNICNNNVVLD
jgi:hypothetical protein